MSPDQNIGLAPHSPAICNQCGNLSSLSLSLCLPLLFIFTPTAKIHLYSTVNWSVLYVLFEVYPLVKSFQVNYMLLHCSSHCTHFTVLPSSRDTIPWGARPISLNSHLVTSSPFYTSSPISFISLFVPFHSHHMSSHITNCSSQLTYFTPRPIPLSLFSWSHTPLSLFCATPSY